MTRQTQQSQQVTMRIVSREVRGCGE
jgi:hypothetical protein